MQIFIKLLFRALDDSVDSEPNDEIGYYENCGKDKQGHRLKGDPRVYYVAENIRDIEQGKMSEERLGNRPAIYLIEHTCTCVSEDEKVSRDYCGEGFNSRKREILQRKGKYEIYYTCDYGTEASEGDAAKKKVFYVCFCHNLNPILSLTDFNCLRET